MTSPTPGTDPLTALVAERLLKERIVVIGTEITDDVANRVTGQLLLLAGEDPDRDIDLYLNSPGGSVTAGLAIYDTMQLVPPEIATWGLGFTASMAQVLLCAGARGKRHVLPNARVLMHQPSAGFQGTSSDVQIRAEAFRAMKRQTAEITARHTGQTVEQVTADSDRDRWFTAQEAVDYGFADRVVSRTPRTVPGMRGTL